MSSFDRIPAPADAPPPRPDETVEQLIARSNLTAPRVTPADLEASIVHTEIIKAVTHSGQVLRWAILTTRNGFAVTGRPSASVNPENDRAEIGEKVAIENARAELWPLLGYALRERQAAEALAKSAKPGPERQMTVVFDDTERNLLLATDRIHGPSGYRLSSSAYDMLTGKRAVVYRVPENEHPPLEWLRKFIGAVEWNVYGSDGVNGSYSATTGISIIHPRT